MIRNPFRSFFEGSLITLGLLAATVPPAAATTISFNAVNVSGNTWQYDYIVTNDSLGADLMEFTVFFDRTQYAILAVSGSAVGWNSLVAQPDADLPDNGFFDSLATGSGIAPGASLAGFAVSFDYLGAGPPPGLQHFDVINPVTFEVVSSGTTTAVPAPGAGWLLSTGALLLARRRRRPEFAEPREEDP